MPLCGSGIFSLRENVSVVFRLWAKNEIKKRYKKSVVKNVIKKRYKRLSQGGSFAHPKFLKVLKAFLKGVQAGIKGAKPLKNPEMR